MNTDKEVFATYDTQLAAYLSARGKKQYPGWKKVSNQIVWLFEDTPELRQTIADYINRADIGRTILYTYRTLKVLIHSEFLGD